MHGRSLIDHPGLRRTFPAWLLLGALVIAFCSQSPYFLTGLNVSNILFQAALIGFVACGLTPVVISGNIDLTVGAIMGVCACLVIELQSLGVAAAIVVSLGAGAVLGLLNGVLVEKTGVSSFIVTLAGMVGLRGLAFVLTGDTSVALEDERLSSLIEYQVGPLSVGVLVFIANVLTLHCLLAFTVHGRNTYAIGGHRTAAYDAGIPVSSHVITNFVVSGILAGASGILMAANLGAASPSYGSGYELWAIIAVVLGGTGLRGGTGSIAGTLVAVLALATLRNGLELMSVPPLYEPLIIGTVLITVLVIDTIITPRRAGYE